MNSCGASRIPIIHGNTQGRKRNRFNARDVPNQRMKKRKREFSQSSRGLLQRATKVKGIRMRSKRRYAEPNVLFERNAKLFGAFADILAAHALGE